MEKELNGRLRNVVRERFGDAQEVHVSFFSEGVTRFANSEIHQNVEEENVHVRAVVVRGNRWGVVTGNRADPESVRALLREAAEIAQHTPKIPDFPGLAKPSPLRGEPPPVDESMFELGPGRRADLVKQAIEIADRQGLTSSGFLSLTVAETAILNTEGLERRGRLVQGAVLFLPYDERGSGYSEQVFSRSTDFDIGRLAREAVDKAVRARDPVELPPGEYPVVLDTYAASDLIGFLAYLGLSALAHQEQRTFLVDQVGKKVFSDLLTIVDDPFSIENPGLAFDGEGEPKARTVFVEKGVLRATAHDRRTAKRAGVLPSGHGLPPPGGQGGFPLNLVVEGGTAGTDDLIRGIGRGVFVTRFHYTNVVDPRKGILTGMTRDGTFLIEDGRITRPVKNLRFTQGIREALSGVSGVGRQGRLTGEWFKVHAPPLRLDRFTFTSATRF